ncbi:hypothetical protein N6B72_10935 [Chryseobacterium soli]|uniref:hypothetical protein n=1 Tax=Chryseobacterium soli TaxID=445961 RepID=UPI0029548C6E|nr:hypothetical protein [Chryseobacterium soli]MDV7697437.1 hypothetical protein [Chryseobacterium soli]
MKTISIIICFLYLFFSNKPSQEEGRIDLIAKVEKIDSIDCCYIIYIKSKQGKGIFTTPKLCANGKNYKYKLQLKRSYLFKLNKEVAYSENMTSESYRTEYINDKLIWTSKMKSTFYEDCLNICSLYIDNEGKPKQCRK